MKKIVVMFVLVIALIPISAMAQDNAQMRVQAPEGYDGTGVYAAPNGEMLADTGVPNGEFVTIVGYNKDSTWAQISSPYNGWVKVSDLVPVDPNRDQQGQGSDDEWTIAEALEFYDVDATSMSFTVCERDQVLEANCWYVVGKFTMTNPLDCWVTGQRSEPDPTQVWPEFAHLDRAPIVGIPPLAQGIAVEAANLRPYCVDQSALEGEGLLEEISADDLADFFDLDGGNGEELKNCGPQCKEVPTISQSQMNQNGPWYVTNVCGNWTDGYTTTDGAHSDNIRPGFETAADAANISIPPHSYRVPVWGATLRSCEVDYVCTVSPIDGQTANLHETPGGAQVSSTLTEIANLDGFVNVDGQRWWRVSDTEYWIMEDESMADFVCYPDPPEGEDELLSHLMQ